MVTLEDVLAARERLLGRVYRTPLEVSPYFSGADRRVSLKLECHQSVRSFKIRGALNKVASLTPGEKARGILAVSSGNHGAGVSYAARLLGGIPAKIFVPLTTPDAKVDRIKYYGAEVVLTGEDYNETQQAAADFLAETPLTYIDPCSDVEVIAGQGTMALEMLEQNPALDMVLVPVGGGGLITGIGVVMKRVKPSVRVIGVQTRACPAMQASLREGIWYREYPIQPSICDAVMGGVGEIPFKMASQCIDELVVVEEEAVREGVRLLLTREKLVAEPSGALGLAALLSHPGRFAGVNLAVIISGGNLDNRLLQDVAGGPTG